MQTERQVLATLHFRLSYGGGGGGGKHTSDSRFSRVPASLRKKYTRAFASFWASNTRGHVSTKLGIFIRSSYVHSSAKKTILI